MKTKYVYDTEFLEDGRTIELISIGIVCEDGREYYAINSEMPIHRIRRHSWLMKHVVPSLPTKSIYVPHKEANLLLIDEEDSRVKPHATIAAEILGFLTAGEHDPELWAFFGAYDHVVYAQLWGPMSELPSGLPMRTRDIADALDTWDGWEDRPVQHEGAHDALEDARHGMKMLQHAENVAKPVWLFSQGIS